MIRKRYLYEKVLLITKTFINTGQSIENTMCIPLGTYLIYACPYQIHILVYALQFTYLFTSNYFVHEGREAMGALDEHFIIKSESNPNNIFYCNVSLICCLKYTCINTCMIVLRRPSFFCKGLYLSRYTVCSSLSVQKLGNTMIQRGHYCFYCPLQGLYVRNHII